MSDTEEGGKKSGYRLEYASSARAKCKGPKPCAGNTIEKGELRFGSLVDFRGNTSFAWRHWGCVTPKIITNMKAQFENADELDGYDELKDEDQERIRKAWDDGHVADEDIPETARKSNDEEEDEDDGKPSKKKADKKGVDSKGKFKLEYASSGRAKCKDGCTESIGKDFFRVGHEVDFRGNKSFAWQHWGCMPATMVAKLKQSYGAVEEIEGFDTLKEAEQEKVKRAWEHDAIPDEDQGPGEAVAVEKKAPVKRAKKDAGAGAKPAKKRARKAKKDDDDDDDEEEEEERPVKKRARKAKYDDEDEDDEKPKAKRGAAKKAPAKEKAAPKKRAPKKKQDDEESGEDFAAELDAVSGDEEEDEPPKPKRKSASKSSAPSSKKAASKPTTSRRKKQEETIEEDDE